MDAIVARILFQNLLKRFKQTEDGDYQLAGVVTTEEMAALRFALDTLSGASAVAAALSSKAALVSPDADGSTQAVEAGEDAAVGAGLADAPLGDIAMEHADVAVAEAVEEAAVAVPREAPLLDLSVLSLLSPPGNARVCLDFGTAMSKASLVEDDAGSGFEDVIVLDLGVPGDQEEISQSMLISSVYIDNEGFIWFGKAAVDRSVIEAADGSRQRLDNIKRRLSEDGLNEKVGEVFNPIAGQVQIVYDDVVLAYLTFLTWAMTKCLDKMGFPRNVVRRFAMPCLPADKSRETAHRLRLLLGEAQVLADTFGDRLTQGLHLAEFVDAVAELRRKGVKAYPFVGEDITEPLGVAGSLLKPTSRMDSMVMVVDVGAGTSDLSLYRIVVDPEGGKNSSLEADGAAIGITEAGNFLDRLLVRFIMKKAGIEPENPDRVRIQRKLELTIRDHKETLFNEGFVTIALPEIDDVMIELDEYRSLDQVKSFGISLRKTMQEILEKVDDSWTDWIVADPGRYLTVVLTGGGANLPMVRELAEGEMTVRGKKIRLVPSLAFPKWLNDDYPELEHDYPRIAVSLGGARRRLIERGGAATIAGGGVKTTPTLGGYYQKGS
ncbi:hypothetical protein [Burkholderia pseudomallei]|uniref:hypothetical protein n=1 Tax=Burkholderia pseudomallei TaxID=28450 RepID=UPI0029324908|nr:hypothetical protein [Burkholderia pseudomallei]MDV2161212.1 hypothetical protein [Burkholderia pseudomallei]MDV2236421.1 hypothetical protein [Burkholderia pseudomallei]